MRTIRFLLRAVVASVSFSGAGQAADFALEGFTTATFDGGDGIRAYTEACQAEFGSTTRMCTSVEVLETVEWPSLPSGPLALAWTQPVYAPSPGNLLDVSGVKASSSGDLTCGEGWLGGGGTGLTTAVTGGRVSFFAESCNQELRIACCAPVPPHLVATVPSISHWGQGVLVALVLSAAGGALLFRGRRGLGSGERRLPR